jgi:glycosyltransferase involved in cell wall biosynthesis
MICSRLDGVIAATPFIRNNYHAMGIRCIDINNFPILGELEMDTGWDSKQNEVCYIGSITAVRGIPEIVEAMVHVASGARLNLAGKLAGTDIEHKLQRSKGWDRVNVLGQIDRRMVRLVLARSFAGLVTFKPGPNHLDAQPNKMFEYMAAGIPVIASNFPLWRKIIEGNECGLLADPLNLTNISEAIDRLAKNLKLARRMGANGRKAVVAHYNWGIEEQKLFDFYETVLA